MKNLQLVQHPLLLHSLTVVRDKSTQTEEFRRHSAILSQLLIIEATRDLKLAEQVVETPLARTSGYKVNDSVVFVPVLRAGLSMLFEAREFLPWASVGFIGLERDEQTARAREYYQKFPTELANKRVLVLDPMLATGGSLVDTITALKLKGAHDIRAICIVAAPEGIESLQNKYPEVIVYTAAVDDHLNQSKYIVPGLGDFGDRYFATL